MDRRVAEARELEPRVTSSAFAVISQQRLAVGRLEIGADRGAALLVIDAHEARGLAVSDRWRERREVEKLGQHRLVRRFAGAKMPDVAPPARSSPNAARKPASNRGAWLNAYANSAIVAPSTPDWTPGPLA